MLTYAGVQSRPCRNNSVCGSTLSSIREHSPLPLPRAARASALRHQFSLLAGLELFGATRPAVRSRFQVYIHFTLVPRCTPRPNCGCFARALILGMLWTPASDSQAPGATEPLPGLSAASPGVAKAVPASSLPVQVSVFLWISAHYSSR